MSLFNPQPILAIANALRNDEIGLHEYLLGLETYYAEREPQIEALVPEPKRFNIVRRNAVKTLLGRWPDPASRPPLFGVPLGVKDIIHVDGWRTRAGTALPWDEFQGAQATVVTRLLDAGALVMGKTVTTEFACFAPGPTRNPNNVAHTPGGSSSGSAAGVAAGLYPLALGTQTGGSIIRPAAFCGVVGFKASFGRIPRDGVLLVSEAFDHVGPIAADVASVTLAASFLCDGWDSSIEVSTLPVLGVPDGPYLDYAAPSARQNFEETLAKLTQQGFKIVRIPALADFAEINARHNFIQTAQLAQVHSDLITRYVTEYQPPTVRQIQAGLAADLTRLDASLQSQHDLKLSLVKQMQTHQIDAWVMPSTVDVAPAGLASTGDPAMNVPWSQSGLPAVTLPSGKAANGLPYGLQIAGHYLADEQLLSNAARIELALRS